MSRKRASAAALADCGLACSSVDGYNGYEYYRPGCYCTPQVVRHASPHTCAYLHEWPAPNNWWNAHRNAVTYVVDARGMAYYLSDFEYQLQLPRNLALQTESIYLCCKHDEDDNSVVDNEKEEEGEDEEAVSPRKRERFECVYLDDEEDDYLNVMQNDHKPTMEDLTAPNDEQRRVYRSKEGYLVEEPSETDSGESVSVK